jgi:hypothetical protein
MADPDNTSFQDPIDWDALNDIVVGTHTFENVLYNPDELDSRAPPYYRTGKTRDGGEPKYQSHSFATRFWGPEKVADFIRSANEGKTPENTEGTSQKPEEVALTPTESELDQWKDEYDNGPRSYEPHFVRTPFFSKRVIGNTGTAAAFSMAIREARNGDDPRWGYSWEADYETGSVTIEIWETN